MGAGDVCAWGGGCINHRHPTISKSTVSIYTIACMTFYEEILTCSKYCFSKNFRL